ncbi:hypothetical protein ACE1CI_36535 [Aerosakkonemataceae cyanobacterium BLCC-F50]|uniref:Uncharacterized protein n=1 Tax=Floridaenema flaviceps BLCC-F50 TaxID=3153642 RepID=A0ABV4Y583_9CYAN
MTHGRLISWLGKTELLFAIDLVNLSIASASIFDEKKTVNVFYTLKKGSIIIYFIKAST